MFNITIALEAQAWCLPQRGGSGSRPPQRALTTALSEVPGVEGRPPHSGCATTGQATQGSKSKADLVFRVLGEEPQGLGPTLRLCSVFYPLFNTKYLKNSFLNPGSLPACFLNHKGAGLCFLSHYSLFHRHRSQVGEVLPGPAGLQCWGWRSPEEG